MTHAKSTNHLPLTPIVHRWVAQLLANRKQVDEAFEKFGSPLNIHSIKPFEENIQDYKDVFEQFELRHKIFFARKANKCITFPISSEKNGEGVDTASFRELNQCLRAGISPENLLLTAAVKNEKLLRLAVENKVTVVIDNRDELNTLRQIAVQLQTPVLLNVRLGGFVVDEKRLQSRFGFSIEEADSVICEIHRDDEYLHYTGLHFHLNGYSTLQRAVAIEQCLILVDALKEKGINTLSLDIGGGFLINYLSDRNEWNDFHTELRAAILGKRDELTYQNDPLGIIKIEQKLYGEPTVYPFYNELNKAGFLTSILTHVSTHFGRPIYELIRQRNIELRMEPGRSLLDQCGITVAQVAFRKRDSSGNLLIGLEMNRTQLRSSSADFLLDPIHICKTGSSRENATTYGFLVGAYCLEQELILKRKIAFKCYPEIGDYVIFPNTAGYMMHFFESEAHLFELAKNLFYTDGKALMPEEEYDL